jgi:hypothetical protein
MEFRELATAPAWMVWLLSVAAVGAAPEGPS